MKRSPDKQINASFIDFLLWLQQRAADMEQQIHRQRDRTMALLAEKAQEIDSLRQQLNNRYGATTMQRSVLV